jgi:hypothetical protein
LWERKFAKYCDETPGILHWASEEFFIPYVSPVDGRIHRYFPDFMIEVRQTVGVKTFIIEIKPKRQSQPPDPKKRKTRRYLSEAITFAVNQAKWAAAEHFCRERGYTFQVVTEDELFGKGSIV